MLLLPALPAAARPAPRPPKRAAAMPALLPARVHEVTGPAAIAFALMQAAMILAAGRPDPRPRICLPEDRHDGPPRRRAPLVWLQAGPSPEALLPVAIARFLAPETMILVQPASEPELLWAAEEALRAGEAGMVIACPALPLSLTAGRRLQLAAEAGQTTGLLVIAEGAGSHAAETRWRCRPDAVPGPVPGPHPPPGPTPATKDHTIGTRQRWTLARHKIGALGSWNIAWDPARQGVQAQRAPRRATAGPPPPSPRQKYPGGVSGTETGAAPPAPPATEAPPQD